MLGLRRRLLVGAGIKESFVGVDAGIKDKYKGDDARITDRTG